MNSFGSKMATLRKSKKLNQSDLAKSLSTSMSVIGRYERDEMTPSINAAVKIATILDTTVGYLLGETNDADLLKDKNMLKRLNEISNLPIKEKEAILLNLDAFLRDFKTRQAYA